MIITADQLPKTTANTDLVYNSNSDTALTDSFKFKVNDGISNSSAAIVSITIDPVNDKPIATLLQYNIIYLKIGIVTIIIALFVLLISPFIKKLMHGIH